MNALLHWLDDRTGYKALMHEALYENVPGGARWRYVWGSTLVFTFTVQVITGLFLWMAYSPSSQTAWESVYFIQYEVPLGWLLRGLHHYTAQAMIVLLALHLMQVVIDGAYKAPREVNFWLGLILMQIVLGLSLTGYLLPWDQKGYWATKVATNIAGITPVVGTQVQQLAVGGPTYGHHTLTRFFALHAGLLPASLVLFLVLHIWVFRRHGITAPDAEWKANATFWPDQVLKDAVACLAVLATVMFFILRHGAGPHGGAELGAPADATEQYSAARPEWYFLFLFQFLKYFPGETEIYGAMVIPGAIMGFMFLMPILGQWKLGHRFNVLFLFALMAGIGFLTFTAIKEDQGNEGFGIAVKDAEMKAERAKELVKLKTIGYAGALALMHEDSKIQGGPLFKKKCSSCHAYSKHDGTGGELASAPTASDLGKFGTRQWIHGMLNDPAGPENFGPTEKTLGDRFTKGSMAKWVDEYVKGHQVTDAEMNAVIEFLIDQGRRADEPAPDPKLVEDGKTFFLDGSDKVAESCNSCHALKLPDIDDAGGGSGPDLTGYGSAAWLRSFIRDPGHSKFYGKKNAMSAFPADKLSDKELDLIVEWLLHGWAESPKE